MKQTSIGLFDSFVKNFNEISILFDNAPIRDNLIYVKGTFINDGDIDIEGERLESPVTIMLPAEYQWKNCKVTLRSDNLKCDISQTNSSQLQLEFGLFRKGEFVQIEALIEASHDVVDDANIFDKFSFSHRIPQTQQISSVAILTETQLKKKKGKIVERAWTIAAQILALIVVSIAFSYFLKSAEFNYASENELGQREVFKATAKQEGKVEIENIVTGHETIIPISEFQDKSKYTPFIPEKTFWQKIKDLLYIAPIWIIIYVAFGLFDYWEVRKSNRIYRIIGKK